ncbi:MAG: hypothetical protein M9899_00080 [Bdellovibrionaceae bacterium]|nr:hypothetical protein [Pseudobdellovibrionaceae bacterium]
MVQKLWICVFLIFSSVPSLAKNSAATTDEICEVLSTYYVETFKKHQELAQEIQSGPHWSLEDLNRKVELLDLLGKYLFDTARQLEKYSCDIDLELE